MSIRDSLIPALQEAFPDHGIRVSAPPDPIAVFPALCAEVGDVLVYDDGDEATIVIENVTHHHTNPYDSGISEHERELWITERVLAFLHELFSDRVLLWSVEKGRTCGGWHGNFNGIVPSNIPAEADTYVWSRRISRTG